VWLNIGERIISGGSLTRTEALSIGELKDLALQELFYAALRVTRHFHGKKVDLCSIINAKSGRCSEDCTFCAQSGRYRTGAAVYPLLSPVEILRRAKEMEALGARRFSLVTSGRGVSSGDFAKILEICRELVAKTSLKLCASLGIIDGAKARQLKEAGVERYHHNIESSRGHFPNVCTTHTFEERVETIRAAREAGLEVCCGGIVGLGESWADGVDMAFTIKVLAASSVPLNVLTPVPGTPLYGCPPPAPLEVLKTVAMFRLSLPAAEIRLAGGREAGLRDLQPLALLAGANGLMVGNYLTTGGRSVMSDLRMLADLELDH